MRTEGPGYLKKEYVHISPQRVQSVNAASDFAEKVFIKILLIVVQCKLLDKICKALLCSPNRNNQTCGLDLFSLSVEF